MPKIFFLLWFSFTLSGMANAQKSAASRCDYANKFHGIWVLEEAVTDLSGENIEEEGQAWAIRDQEMESLKGKVTLTIFADGTVSSEGPEENHVNRHYGHWDISRDCQEIHINMDNEPGEPFEIIAIDATRLVIKPLSEDRELANLKLVFKKAS